MSAIPGAVRDPQRDDAGSDRIAGGVRLRSRGQPWQVSPLLPHMVRRFVEVQDTGPGLDPEKLDRLFQSFYTTKPDGMGMGLAISRSIIEAHNGRLSAEPNKPRGAIFRLTLPSKDCLAGPGVVAL